MPNMKSLSPSYGSKVMAKLKFFTTSAEAELPFKILLLIVCNTL